MNSGTPVVESGAKVSCPKCRRAIYRVNHNVYYGQHWNYQLFEPLEGAPTPHFRMPAISKCCGVAWCIQGAIFLEKKGWVPYNPYETFMQ